MFVVATQKQCQKYFLVSKCLSNSCRQSIKYKTYTSVCSLQKGEFTGVLYEIRSQRNAYQTNVRRSQLLWQVDTCVRCVVEKRLKTPYYFPDFLLLLKKNYAFSGGKLRQLRCPEGNAAAAAILKTSHPIRQQQQKQLNFPFSCPAELRHLLRTELGRGKTRAPGGEQRGASLNLGANRSPIADLKGGVGIRRDTWFGFFTGLVASMVANSVPHLLEKEYNCFFSPNDSSSLPAAA